jgi:hypothetical protein
VAALRAADVELEMLRSLLRLGQELRYMSLDQYRHVSTMLVEIGRQLGGWLASSERQRAAVGSGS